MLTPLSNPLRLAAMKSGAGPWNQVAVIQPAVGCHTVANRSQSPASRHSAQFSTSSRMANLSASAVGTQAPLSWPDGDPLGGVVGSRLVERGAAGSRLVWAGWWGRG